MNNKFTEGFPADIKPDMRDYYKMRQKVRELYSVGAMINPKVNDLCSSVLQIRDKNRCVESIKVDTLNYYIEVEIEEGTDYEKCLKVKDSITKTIDDYINENIDSIGGYNGNTKLYDDVSVGTYIRFNL